LHPLESAAFVTAHTQLGHSGSGEGLAALAVTSVASTEEERFAEFA